MKYSLFVIPMNGHVKLAKDFTIKSEGILAFDAVVRDSKMRAVFLDQREDFSNGTHSVINIKKWRKRASKTKGQSR